MYKKKLKSGEQRADVSTIMENQHLPLSSWFYIYNIVIMYNIYNFEGEVGSLGRMTSNATQVYIVNISSFFLERNLKSFPRVKAPGKEVVPRLSKEK